MVKLTDLMKKPEEKIAVSRQLDFPAPNWFSIPNLPKSEMDLLEFINSDYVDYLSDGQRNYLIENRKFKSRSVVEKQLSAKFEDVSFTGKGSDIRIKIAGDYKWLSTIEFLREARNRCEYKLVSLANDAKGAKWPGTIYTLADDTTGMGELYEWNFSERTTKDSRLDDLLLEPEDEDCVFDSDYEESEKQHYIKLMALFKIYLNTPTKKRGGSHIPLYLITVDGSFDDTNLTIEVACDTRERKNYTERVSLFATEDNSNEFESLEHKDFRYLEHIVNAFEVPYIQKEYGNTTAHEVSNVTNFTYTLERINDYI